MEPRVLIVEGSWPLSWFLCVSHTGDFNISTGGDSKVQVLRKWTKLSGGSVLVFISDPWNLKPEGNFTCYLVILLTVFFI